MDTAWGRPPVDISDGIERVPVVIESGLNTEDVLNFKYCKVNIPGQGSDQTVFEEQFDGCRCQGQCDLEKCSCLSRFGQKYDTDGRMVLETNQHSGQMEPIIECNKLCSCSIKCVHRCVQHGVRTKLQVFNTKVKGYGLRTLETIPRNCFVCEYAGEVISLEEAKFRSGKQKSTDKNYILVLNEFCKGKVWRTCVDPEHVGNVGRFINHSCDPNLFMIPVRVDNNVPKLSLFAVHDVAPGTELTFDYSGSTVHCEQKELVSKVDDQKLKQCVCCSEKCRGYLPFDECLYTSVVI